METHISWVGDTASRPAAAGGAAESPSTPRGEYTEHMDAGPRARGRGEYAEHLPEQDAFPLEEWQALQDLRFEAERQMRENLDRAALRGRNARYAAHLAAARHALNADPFWQAVDALCRRAPHPDPGAPSVGGIDRDSLARALGREHAAELAKRRPGLVNAQGTGLPLDLAALEHGYDDADVFACELYDRLVTRGQSKTRLARDMADAALADEDARSDPGEELPRSDAYAAYLEAVDKAVLRLAAARPERPRTPEETRAFIERFHTPRALLREQARRELERTPVRHIRPDRYSAAVRKGLEERTRLLAEGDPSGAARAARAVNAARLAHELWRQSIPLLGQRERVESLAARLAALKPGALPSAQAEGVRRVLAAYGMGRAQGAADDALRDLPLADLIRRAAGEDVGDVIPSFADWLTALSAPDAGNLMNNGRFDYRGLTPPQLEELGNLLRFFEHTGRQDRADGKDSEAVRVKALAVAGARAMAALPNHEPGPEGSPRRAWRQGPGPLPGSADALARRMGKVDGFSSAPGPQGVAGPLENGICLPLLRAEQRARARLDTLAGLLSPHLAALAGSVRQWESAHGKNLHILGEDGRPLPLPRSIAEGYGRSGWNADMAIALALNMGNRSNMDRVVSGYPDLTHDVVSRLLGTDAADALFRRRTPGNRRRQGLLSAADWRSIQGIWDALGTQWPDTRAVHERLFGFKPGGMPPTPLSLTVGGETVSLNGGCYPVRHDPELSGHVDAWTEREDILSRNDSLFAVPAAERGHAQARAAKAAGRPVRLDTGVLMEHINDAVRFIELAEIVRFADKTTRDPQFRAAYTRVFGREEYDAIRPNLRGLVRQEPPPGNAVVMAADKIRNYLVPWGLAWNFKAAAVQLTALFPAMGDVGARHVGRSMAALATRGMGLVREVWNVSPYMRGRMRNIDQELRTQTRDLDPAARCGGVALGGRTFTREDCVNLGMMPLIAVDTAATASVWLGAYTKKLTELQDSETARRIGPDSALHQQAAAFADVMVKKGAPDFDPPSRSGFPRANGANQLIDDFASAITLFAQRNACMRKAHEKGAVSGGRPARFELYDTLVPAAAVFLLPALARGYFGDEDGTDGLLKLFMGTLFDMGSMRLPLFGPLIADGVLGFSGPDEGGNRKGGVRAALDAPLRRADRAARRSGKLPSGEAMTDEDWKRVAYGVADIAAFLSRAPFSDVARNAERGCGQRQRGEGIPLSVIS